MKKLIIIIILSLNCFVLNAQWIQQNSGTESNLNSIYFIDNENGWAVGSDGVILNTSDGGANWNQQSSGTDLTLESVQFINQDIGWIAGGQNGYDIILRSMNGGNSWDIVYIDSVFSFFGYLHDLYFIDSLKGWAIGGELIHTEDGGDNWEGHLGTGKGIYFIDSLNGWCVGGAVNGSTGYPNGFIKSTINGGNNWTTQASGGAQDEFGILFSICFTDLYNGWAVGGNPGGWPPSLFSTILHTSDGGANWEIQSSPNEQCLKGVCFTDNLNGWAVGGIYFLNDYVIINTKDGGESWSEQFSETNNMLNSVNMLDQEIGWIAGDSGTILHTNNGGMVHIREFQSPKSIASDFICYPNPAHNIVTISSRSGETEFAVSIYNQTGLKVFEGNIRNNTIDVSGYLQGFYIIEVKTKTWITRKKLIVRRF